MSNFTTKSRTIELLGKKQIRDGVTALIELIKNAYDADAKTCRIIFNDYRNRNYILIADNGCGMTQKDILEKWMVIGTDSKYNTKRVTPSGRVMMGEKGIGRLAASTLGNQLLMITKSLNSSGWELLFVDWNLFNNKFATLDQIDIGHLSNCVINKPKDITQLINEVLIPVKENLKKDFWYFGGQIKEETEESYSKINEELNDYSADVEKIYNQMRIIEKKGQGTILYITNINDDWYKILDSRDSKTEKKNNGYYWENYSRLNTFIFNTNNSTNDFEIKVWCKDEIKEFSYGFTKDDYNNYDLKIKGKISNGIFTGELKAINANEEKLKIANDILKNGINVSPSDMGEITDCGDFTIEFIHIEGSEISSSLNSDIWHEQVKKLELYGGISVYRDGVRILPYGEPRNDFLGIEERRTRGVGYYVFSHRRMYGRIDITRKNNPLLEDKSNREGLIENRAYFYFVAVISNLLIFLAVDIINGLGLRESYMKYNADSKKAAELHAKMAKELERQNNAYIKEIKDKINELRKILKSDPLRKVFSEIDDALFIANKKQDVDALVQLDVVSSLINTAKNNIHDLASKEIEIDRKFSAILENELLIEVYSLNEKIKDYCNQCTITLKKLQSEKDKIKNVINDLLEKNKSPRSKEYESLIQNKCNDLMAAVQTEIKSNLFNSSANENINMLIHSIQKLKTEIDRELQDINTKAIDGLNAKLLCLSKIKSNIEYNTYSTEELSKMTQEISDIENALNDIIALKFNRYKLIDRKYEYLKTLNSIFKSNIPTGDYLEGLISVNNSLRQENTVLAELANVGLAAEVVDHEFNQYFTNVKYAINNLNASIKDNTQKYWLKQIYEGFIAISNRHSQLSPSYRSKNLWKREVSLKLTIDALTDFFKTRLEKNKITIINEVNQNITVFASPSKLQPILSNLMDNSIYWLQNAEEKKIFLYFDNSKKSLYIEDTGPGIPNYLTDKIFELFFTTKPNNSGRGIGLYITKKILEMDGFGISLVKGKYGTGACFEITFGGNSNEQ